MSSTAVFEHSYYIGNYMSGILYGFELVMYFATLKCLFRNKRSRRGDLFFALYSTALLVLLTIDISTNAVWGEQMWITFRDMPGGPSAFIAQDLSVWYQIVGSTSVVALIFLGDALLLYRCFILRSSDYRIIALPILVYLAAFSLAIVELVGAFTPGGNFFGGRTIIFGTTYYAMSISLNIILFLLICARLLYLSRLMRSSLGEDHHETSQLYTSIAAIMAESAAPYTLVGIMFLVPYARESQTSISFGQVYAKLACLSPQLIVLRVAKGRAWGKDTVQNAQSTLSFESHVRGRTILSSLPFTGTQLSDLPPASTAKDTTTKGWKDSRSTQDLNAI